MPVELSHGRGATRNSTPTRFNLKERIEEGDWLDQVEALDGVPTRRTTVTIEHPKSILTRNSSPDIGFDRSVNAFRAASMAASIASRDRRTLSTICRPAWISNRGCS